MCFHLKWRQIQFFSVFWKSSAWFFALLNKFGSNLGSRPQKNAVNQFFSLFKQLWRSKTNSSQKIHGALPCKTSPEPSQLRFSVSSQSLYFASTQTERQQNIKLQRKKTKKIKSDSCWRGQKEKPPVGVMLVRLEQVCGCRWVE